MKLNRFLIIAIVSVSIFSACREDEGDTLAKHELVLEVSMGDTETRVTPEGTWTKGDLIAVKVGTTVKKYEIKEDGIARGYDATNTFYWEDFDESSFTVSAWSFGKEYYDAIPDVITVKTDQTDDDDYSASDFLYAKETTVSRETGARLIFCHQMGYMGLSITMDDPTANIVSVTIGKEPDSDYKSCIIGAKYTKTTLDTESGEIPDFGTFDFNEEEEMYNGIVTPHKWEDASGKVIYSAILVPYFYESLSIVITLDDGTEYNFILGVSCNAPEIKPGEKILYNVSIRNQEITVVNGPRISVIDWQ